MKVANKIRLGLALLVVLLIGAVALQISLVRRLVENHRNVAEIQAEAVQTLGQLGVLAEKVGTNIQKYRVTKASAYRQEVSELQDEFRQGLSDLRSLMDALEPENETSTGLTGNWRNLIDIAVSRADDLELHQSFVEDYQGWLDLMDDTEKLGLLKEDLPKFDGIEEVEVQRRLALVDDLEQRVKALREATDRTIDRQHEQSLASSRRFERLTGFIAVAVILLTVLIGLGIIRSINRPLRRLIDGTRAVAEGRFTYQLETTSRDEFAGLAASFNTMVRRLDELDQMKKDFVARVSHDLKAPLAAMQETHQLLVEEIPGPLNEQQKRILGLNLESGQRLSVRISKLLDLSRMAAGGLSLDLKPQDLNEMVRFVATEFEARFRSAHLNLILNLIEPRMPLFCDRDRVLQVIENLLENGLKYSPSESDLRLSVRRLAALPESLPQNWRRKLEKRRPEAWCWLALSDQGPGVPDEHKTSIFYEFHQVVPARRRGGVGLGLAICREIVAAHEGAIWVTDGEEVGSLFHLLLPTSRHPLPSEASPVVVADEEREPV